MTIKELRNVLDAFGNEDAEVIAFDEKGLIVFNFKKDFADNNGFLQLYLDKGDI